MSAPVIAGLVLAAGGGRRLGGRPKALLQHRGRPLVVLAAAALRAAGCTPVCVVTGAAAPEVGRQAGPVADLLVENAEWRSGMGSSLRAGLLALAALDEAPDPTSTAPASSASAALLPAVPDAVLVSLVDQPGVGAAAMARVVAACTGPASLVVATYHGRRGHPVLLGAEHWSGAAGTARGDRGAREYLRENATQVTWVECADIASAQDLDTPSDLSFLLPPD